MADNILEMKNIIKTFPGVRALDDVNFTVKRGEIHAVCGENGAGKSTLMNVLSGVYPYGDYSGDIVYNGEVCQFNGINDSEEKGIVIVHQELALVPNLSVGENIFLGNEVGSKHNIDWDATHEKAKELLNTVGLDVSPHTLIEDIGMGMRQLVEIAKALSKDVKLLILDEPTSSLNEKESKELLDLILEFQRQGISSIIISHKLNEISYVADAITIIRDGKSIETIPNQDRTVDEDRIVRGMVGREMTDRYPDRDVEIGETIFELKNWTVHDPNHTERKAVNNVDLTLRSGEIVGIAGLVGAGRTELAMSVFGRSYGENISGQIIKDGQEVELKTIREAIDNKIAYLTEDRKENGLILSESIRINTTLAKMDKVSKNQTIDFEAEKAVAEQFRKSMNVVSTSIEQQIGNLSGGNQQKILLGKWVFTDPDVLFLDEPTRGVDVGAKYEIYTIINDLVAEGKGVIMISSELPELLGMCDRIYIMNEGRFIGEMDGTEATQENIMSMIVTDAN
ncbi:MAG: sugar ABC transporter ATP-binding protein [Clostridiaceae bacterium]|nr:sugar ABC transporter ATP-binding protein [Clostridiaceae bacterium]